MGSPGRLAAMREAVFAGDVAKVRLLLKAGVPAGAGVDGASFLRLAANHAQTEVFEVLAAAGADLAEPELLEWAVDGGGGRLRPSLAIVARVLAAVPPGPDGLARALRYACTSGGEDVVAHLLAAGAGPDAADPATGATPLGNAVGAGHLAVVTRLLEAGADPDRPRLDLPGAPGLRLADAADRLGRPELGALLRGPR